MSFMFIIFKLNKIVVNVLLIFFYYKHPDFNGKSGYLIISESKQDKQEDTCLLGYRSYEAQQLLQNVYFYFDFRSVLINKKKMLLPASSFVSIQTHVHKNMEVETYQH